MIATEPLIELKGVAKSFGSNKVIHHIDFDLQPGEIHALVGENGAGKSTCLGMMYGLHQSDAGSVYLSGKQTIIENPAHAQRLGIGCVFQELSLAGGLSVAENIYAGHAPSRGGIVDWKKLRKSAADLLAEFNLDIDVKMPVDRLPISSRQVVEIAKALSLSSQVILLDEPTSALTPDEVSSLFTILRKLTERGIGIVYVSHHMSEIFEISDRITVLRDGRKISTRKPSETSENEIVTEMIGGQMPTGGEASGSALGEVVLEAKNLSFPGVYEDVSLTLRKGEIVGLAGLMGSRRSVIAKALTGLFSSRSGSLNVKGKDVHFSSLPQAMAAGLGYVPEERKTDGLFLDHSVRDNLIAASLGKHTSNGLFKLASARTATSEAIKRFSVKTKDQDTAIRYLSGGNQQKIMLAKWLETDPDILIIDEPTKGVDVGAKFQIHDELRKRAEDGMAILVVSSDFPELAALTNRIVVVREGKLAGEVRAENATDESILRLAAGVDASSATTFTQDAEAALQ
ncbi:sugar ABC transporter ATP-binding protein [Labrenzia sp. PHM005]|uniref:sugar ABC transporter ATP-binding protein n=1 Tax=Labrenzia sp. PHM005 TaxID=2590016 RepID=UPI0011405440|nr:sugar ABC transporter ATP-binding protein [Labrenzia sp. PHM005]QDG75389.1 sugar ABC transporter ATP-binding protein [Labrenzia sp. PHM005]